MLYILYRRSEAIILSSAKSYGAPTLIHSSIVEA